MNHETTPLTVVGGSSPSQPGCAEVDAIGVLAPNEIRQTVPFSTAKTCDYHVPRWSVHRQ